MRHASVWQAVQQQLLESDWRVVRATGMLQRPMHVQLRDHTEGAKERQGLSGRQSLFKGRFGLGMRSCV